MFFGLCLFYIVLYKEKVYRADLLHKWFSSLKDLARVHISLRSDLKLTGQTPEPGQCDKLHSNLHHFAIWVIILVIYTDVSEQTQVFTNITPVHVFILDMYCSSFNFCVFLFLLYNFLQVS